MRNPRERRSCHSPLSTHPARVPLHLTAKERRTLATIVALLVLGLIGMAVLKDAPDQTVRSRENPPAPPDARR